MEIFKPSESHGFLLLYFLFILILGKCLFDFSTRCLWNVSKASCVSVALLIWSQLTLLMAWQIVSLFWKICNLLNMHVSFSLISICLATWNTGNLSDISVMNSPCMECLYHQYNWWIYCETMSLIWQSLLRDEWYVAKYHCLTSYKKSAVCACIA